MDVIIQRERRDMLLIYIDHGMPELSSSLLLIFCQVTAWAYIHDYPHARGAGKDVLKASGGAYKRVARLPSIRRGAEAL